MNFIPRENLRRSSQAFKCRRVFNKLSKRLYINLHRPPIKINQFFLEVKNRPGCTMSNPVLKTICSSLPCFLFLFNAECRDEHPNCVDIVQHFEGDQQAVEQYCRRWQDNAAVRMCRKTCNLCECYEQQLFLLP